MRRMRAPVPIRFLLPLLVFVAVGAGPADPPAPSMFRGDAAGTGRDPAAQARSADALAGVRFTFDAGSPIRATPVVRDGLLFVAGLDGTLHALDAATGAERWRHRAGAPVTASPATDGRLVWPASRDGRLAALDAKTGNPRWRRDLGRDAGRLTSGAFCPRMPYH